MVSDYINLKVHTQFSICEGAVKISKLSTFCKENNISAVGICDKSNLSGALEFSQELIKQGIQPIIGTSIFLKEIIDRKEFFGTISLFAKNQIGYKNLLKLSSESYLSLKNSEEHPSISLEFLKKFSDGLIILIGGSKSFFSDLLNLNKDKYCTDEIIKLKKIFNDNIYIEIQRHNEKHETDLEKKLLKLGSDLSIPLIATNEVFYLDPETFNAHDAYICVGEKTYVNEKNRLKYSNKHFFLKNDDFSNLFKDLPDALENNKNFKYRINFFPKKSKPLLPSFSENNEDSWLNRYNANTVEYTSETQQINVFPAQVSATCSFVTIVELFIAIIALLTHDKLVMVLLTLQLLLGQLPATPLAPRLDSIQQSVCSQQIVVRDGQLVLSEMSVPEIIKTIKTNDVLIFTVNCSD